MLYAMQTGAQSAVCGCVVELSAAAARQLLQVAASNHNINGRYNYVRRAADEAGRVKSTGFSLRRRRRVQHVR